MPNPNDPRHADLENRVVSWLQHCGWLVPSAMTYHEVFDRKSIDTIAKMNDATSICVRTRADRIAISPHAGLSVKFELKTIPDGKTNFACEALPLLWHMRESFDGVLCVYAIWREADGAEFGFVVDKSMPLASKLFVPPGKVPKSVESTLMSAAERAFPNAEIVQRHVGGSGDPFIVVPSKKIENWKHWADVFSELGGRK